MAKLTKAQHQQVREVKQRMMDAVDPQRTAARNYVRQEAEQAGLDEDMVEACVDSAMSAYDDIGHDTKQWEDMVASVVQGHAMP